MYRVIPRYIPLPSSTMSKLRWIVQKKTWYGRWVRECNINFDSEDSANTYAKKLANPTMYE